MPSEANTAMATRNEQTNTVRYNLLLTRSADTPRIHVGTHRNSSAMARTMAALSTIVDVDIALHAMPVLCAHTPYVRDFQ